MKKQDSDLSSQRRLNFPLSTFNFPLYNLILAIGFVILSPRFAFDAITKGKYASGFRQRLGYLPAIVDESKLIIWLHCVSVGETNAAQPLVKKILAEFPQHQIVVSTTTRTGQNLARELFKSDAATVFYFPFDFKFAVRRVLKHIKPQAVLIMETEIWFNFLRECRKQNVKTALINGRLSPTSFRNYKLIRGFMSEVLTNLDLALMQSESDANRILQLGIAPGKVTVTGNVKFDLSFDANETDLTREFRERFEVKTPLIIAASTHEPEEKWIVEAFKRLRADFPNDKPRLLIAPRHPERFGAVENLLKNSGFSFAKRSGETAIHDKEAEIILLDSIGELKSVYSLAEIVFVGGSLMTKG
ncbi:MAG: 3-deoxy-D-manno-octulosonic acid transferase, partial [Pyrinomonadaceae bacterium]|nr:3-deoxy-D-manno-octulosonic acid transferase [Pyrinomonadaceae bacterium]